MDRDNRIAVDISGRHEDEGRYLMVCAAVLVSVSSDSIDEVKSMRFNVNEGAREPTFEVLIDTVNETVSKIQDDSAVVVTEKGEFYNKPQWVVEGALGHGFKYVETIGERKAVGIAHHAAYAARRLLLEI